MKHWNKFTLSFCTLVLFSGCSHAVHADGTLTATTPTKDRYSIFSPGDTVTIAFEAIRPTDTSADTLDWTVEDYLGKVKQSGKIPVTAGDADWKSSLDLTPLPAGYYAIRAHLEHSGLTLEKQGSRPEGMSTFGILSGLTRLPLAHPDDSHFGIQGGIYIQSNHLGQGDYIDPVTTLLGARWVGNSGRWYELEPERSGQYVAKPNPSDWAKPMVEAKDHCALLTVMNGMPTWALDLPPGTVLPQGKATPFQRDGYPPRDYTLFGDFVQKVGLSEAALRKAQFPQQKYDYYQITWEPDIDWKAGDAALLKVYQTAYEALHKTDPQAVVLGPTYSRISEEVKRLEVLLPMGFGKYLDGISTHGYYYGTGEFSRFRPGILMPPEKSTLIADLRRLQEMKKQYLAPGAKLFQTEWGMNYYGTNVYTTALLHDQAAVETRGHIINLGEGADVSYFFYAADTSNEPVIGFCFNLTMDKTPMGATAVSPKPLYMAGAALTQMLEGTKTLGPVPGTASASQVKDKDVYGYAFQRATQTVAALWDPDGSKKITVHVGADHVKAYDMMGNETDLSAPNGQLTLTVSQDPVYLLGVTQPAIQ